MSFTALTRKSVTDLTRRKARAFFTVLTLALAVASVGIFALNPLMDGAMKRGVVANRLPDVTVSMKPLALSQGEIERLGRLPNVTAVEPRNLFATRVWVGARRDRALIVGIPDFANQHADVVAVESGTAPRTGAVLVDRNDRTHTKFTAGINGVARVLSADGRVKPLRISGVASNLTGADRVVSGFITFYTGVATVARLRGATGYTSLGFRLRDNSRAAAERTVTAIRCELRSRTAFRAFDDMPVVQDPGGYPGKSEWEKMGGIFTTVTLLALLTALMLVSNTMSTLIGEQTGEIAAMKAIGARRRDIRRLYLRTTLLFGALGALAGSLLGVLLANVLVRFFADLGFGISAGWGISVPIAIASVIVGLVQGRDVSAWGLPARPMMSADVRSGRWYTKAEVTGRAPVAVLGRTIAATTGKHVGDSITLRTASGPVALRVIGISGNEANNGSVVFVPVTTLQSALGSPDAVNSFWITTTSQNHGFIDRVTTRVEDTLAAHGSQVATLVNYDAKQKQVAMNGQITTSITVLGLLIVAISMVGLINAITMAVLERTREIGMLRSVGARARDVRRIFATEGLVVAIAGWLLGVPLGYLLARAIVWLAGRAVGLDIAFVFPVAYALIALLGTVILAWLIMLAPLRRAVRFKPGEAIRYA